MSKSWKTGQAGLPLVNNDHPLFSSVGVWGWGLGSLGTLLHPEASHRRASEAKKVAGWETLQCLACELPYRVQSLISGVLGRDQGVPVPGLVHLGEGDVRFWSVWV